MIEEALGIFRLNLVERTFGTTRWGAFEANELGKLC